MDLEEAIMKTKDEYQMSEKQKEEREVLERYGNMFTPENLDLLTKEDFKSFLLIDNNKHWKGIHRQSNIITQDMDKLKKALKILLDENRPLKERLDFLFPKNKPNYIKGLGRAIVTPMLLVVYPTKYGVYNSRSAEGLRKTKLEPKFGRGISFSEKYIKINEVLKKIAIDNDMSLFELDAVWWKVTGGYETTSAEEIEESEELSTGFRLEPHLRRFERGENMTRKLQYDDYWLSKMDEIHNSILDVINNKRTVKIDVKDIKSCGERKTWYGIVYLDSNGYYHGEMAHAGSLGKIIVKQDFFKRIFAKTKEKIVLRITELLQLEIELTSKQTTKIQRNVRVKSKQRSIGDKEVAEIVKYGFIYVGRWNLDEHLKSGIRFNLDKMKDIRVIYSYIVDDIIKYIGICDSSVTTLRKRMGRYQSQAGAGTNERISNEIRACLKKDCQVSTFALNPEESINYKDLNVDLVKGLENPLIAELKPEWNIKN